MYVVRSRVLATLRVLVYKLCVYFLNQNNIRLISENFIDIYAGIIEGYYKVCEILQKEQDWDLVRQACCALIVDNYYENFCSA